jgi:signal transduction histidine kinase
MSVPGVLVAEDEGILAEEISERITRMGLSVAAIVASGQAAIDRAAETTPDLVLMDIRLKGSIDGVTAARVIRDRLGIPVVFITAHSDAATIDRAKQADPLGYLIKPFTEQELHVTIQMALHRHSRDQLARQLLETQRLDSLGRMAGSVAHRFSNLLVPILGQASVASMDVDPESRLGQRLERITAAAEQAADLCRQMRAYTGSGHVQVGRCDVNRIIADIRDLLHLAMNGATLIFSLVDDLPPVSADPSQIQQLIMNLVLNAAEATVSGQTVAVRTRTGRESQPDAIADPTASWIVIEIADDGVGIDEHTQQHVFEPFFTTKVLGRGLGLAAAQGIARGHGGSIVMESRLGAGSTFRVTLPTAPPSVVNPPVITIP